MIPRHRPPFSIPSLMTQALRGFPNCSIEAVEQAWAELLDVPFAVWLPSARYGICKAIEFTLPADGTVYCPVFTCGVVHEAICRSGRNIRLVDSSRSGFLMDNARLSRSSGTDHAVVLSEVFGYRYRTQLNSALIRDARLRIFDMAMCLPHSEDLTRLRDCDLALISFGLGKPLYAGWGGMALTRNQEMDAWLRQQRQQDIHRPAAAHNVEMVVRTLAQTPACYGVIRSVMNRRQRRRKSIPLVPDGRLQCQHQLPEPSRDWSHAPTQLQLRTAQHHTLTTTPFAKERIGAAQLYQELLSDVFSAAPGANEAEMPWAIPNPDAMSHFCITVPGDVRDALRECLWNHGIDTAVLFEYPSGLHAGQFPHAFQHSSRVVGLPLWTGLSSRRIHQICGHISRFVKTSTELSATATTAGTDTATVGSPAENPPLQLQLK